MDCAGSSGTNFSQRKCQSKAGKNAGPFFIDFRGMCRALHYKNMALHNMANAAAASIHVYDFTNRSLAFFGSIDTGKTRSVGSLFLRQGRFLSIAWSEHYAAGLLLKRRQKLRHRVCNKKTAGITRRFNQYASNKSI